MKHLLEQAGKSFMTATFAAFVVYSTGIFDAPNLHQGLALAVAASVAAVTAGLRALSLYVPKLTLSAWLHLNVFWGGIADTFAQTFVAALLAGLLGVLAAPDLHAATALLVAAGVGAVQAAVHAVEALLTKGTAPAPKVGLPEPKQH